MIKFIRRFSEAVLKLLDVEIKVTLPRDFFILEKLAIIAKKIKLISKYKYNEEEESSNNYNSITEHLILLADDLIMTRYFSALCKIFLNVKTLELIPFLGPEKDFKIILPKLEKLIFLKTKNLSK